MSNQSCCTPTGATQEVKECTLIRKCVLQTSEGEFDCECICKCKCNSSKSCDSCVCDCKCTPETAQKIQTAEGTKYRCECTCSC